MLAGFPVTTQPQSTSRILVFGDSWARHNGPLLQEIITESGHTDIVVVTEFKQESGDLSSASGLRHITFWFEQNPEADLVLLSTGVNDWTINCRADMVGTSAEASLIAAIIDNVEIIVDHILSIRPDAQILWSSYDFFRPLTSNATPTIVNGLQLKIAEQAEQLALHRQPELSYGNLYGL